MAYFKHYRIFKSGNSIRIDNRAHCTNKIGENHSVFPSLQQWFGKRYAELEIDGNVLVDKCRITTVTEAAGLIASDDFTGSKK